MAAVYHPPASTAIPPQKPLILLAFSGFDQLSRRLQLCLYYQDNRGSQQPHEKVVGIWVVFPS
jgi:hypothetical protein